MHTLQYIFQLLFLSSDKDSKQNKCSSNLDLMGTFLIFKDFKNAKTKIEKTTILELLFADDAAVCDTPEEDLNIIIRMNSNIL